MNRLEIVFLFFCFFVGQTVTSDIPHKLKVWGPGLNAEFALPVRYFFLDFRDENENRLQNISIDDVQVQFVSRRTGNVKEFQADLLRNGNHGSTFLYRYRPFHSYYGNDLYVNVFYQSQKMASYPLQGPLHSEDCECPAGLQKWLMDIAKCPSMPHRILKDLKLFRKNGVHPAHNRKVMNDFYDSPYSVSICNYVIKSNRVYRKCLGQYTDFKMFMDSILTSLVKKVKLPDVDFIVNLGDYPLAKLNEKRYTPQIPIFSWCGSTDSSDIVMPTYEMVENSVQMMHRVALDVFSVQDRASHAYSSRISKAFWRGRDSREERLRLVEIAQNEPSLLNASITNFFFFRDQMDKYGGKTAHVPFFDFFDHKFQINVDGTVAAYRLPFLLSGGSTVFKSDSEYYEHFYDKLKADVHYIPVRRDLSDLLEKIRFCLHNVDHCETIGRNGRQFVNDHLLPQHIYCYHVQLLNEFAQLIKGPIELSDGMELVEHEKTERGDNCACHTAFSNESDNKDEL